MCVYMCVCMCLYMYVCVCMCLYICIFRKKVNIVSAIVQLQAKKIAYIYI